MIILQINIGSFFVTNSLNEFIKEENQFPSDLKD